MNCRALALVCHGFAEMRLGTEVARYVQLFLAATVSEQHLPFSGGRDQSGGVRELPQGYWMLPLGQMNLVRSGGSGFQRSVLPRGQPSDITFLRTRPGGIGLGFG